MQSKTAIKTYGFIVFAIMASKLLGLVRDALMANFYGTGMEAAAFSAASRIPLTIFDITLGTAVAAAFIPVMNRFLQNDGKERAFKFVNNFLNAVLLVAIVIAALICIFPGAVVNLLASGFTGDTFSLCASLLMIFTPIILLAAMCYTFVGVLQSFGSFKIPAIMSLLSNALMVLYFVTLNERFGIGGLAAALVIGWVMQLVILLPPLYKFGYRFRFGIDFKDDGLRSSVKMAGPVLISSWVMPINNLITLNIASYYASWGVTVLDYSYKLYFIVAGVFSYAMTNLYFPSLSRMQAAGDREGARDMLYTMIKSVTLIVVPVAAFFIVFSRGIVRVVYESGSFGAGDGQMTALALMMYTVGMFGFSWQEILNKYFYSSGDSKTPMKVAIGSIVINLALALVLSRTPMGIYGIALSSAASITYAGAALYALQNRRDGKKTDGRMGAFIGKSVIMFVISCAVMCVLSYFMSKLTLGRFTTLAALIVAFAVSGVVYLAAAKVLRVSEVTDIAAQLFGRFRGKASAEDGGENAEPERLEEAREAEESVSVPEAEEEKEENR
ncbi:MAG: murein biosynthesis integral membrane protein MurJ [Clostridia bacterium]|nr:murein biosynthesis integral membrane protein MurJ [Clostridia bacterium]